MIVLTYTHNNLHITNSDFFKLNIVIEDQHLWSKCLRDEMKCVWTPLSCCLSKGSVKRHFLDAYLSSSSRVRNLGNILVMRVNFFLEMMKI